MKVRVRLDTLSDIAAFVLAVQAQLDQGPPIRPQGITAASLGSVSH